MTYVLAGSKPYLTKQPVQSSFSRVEQITAHGTALKKSAEPIT
jgi:hypothetical protein